MAAPDTKAVLVPVQLQAFILDASTWGLMDPDVTVANTAGVPLISQPNYRALQLDSSLIQHDVFEHTRLRTQDYSPIMAAPRWYATADPKDSNADRSGVYLHWSLPAAYRVGIAASSSAQAQHAQRKLRAGFPSSSDAQGPPAGVPTFRPVPDRWLIVRHWDDAVAPQTWTDSAGTHLTTGEPAKEKFRFFVVESNVVRSINAIPPLEDVIVTASPLFDPNIPLDQQGERFLGQATTLNTWAGDVTDTPLDTNHIPLTVIRTSNPYFADFQPHNSSVFSFFDNTRVEPGDLDYRADRSTKLSGGTVSYTVIGYHSVPQQDPLVIDPDTSNRPSHAERLKDLGLEITDIDGISQQDLNWLASSAGPDMRTLCCGTLLNMTFDTEKWKRQANDAQKSLRMSHPISVGTNQVDALLGWVRGQVGAKSVAGAPPLLSTPEDIDTVERQLKKLQTWIQSVSDDPDAQLEATDLVATNNFVPAPSGTTWHLKKDASSTSSAISTSDLEKLASDLVVLRRMNVVQDLVNDYIRESIRLKSELFGEWWKYVVDRDRDTADEQSRRRSASTATVAKIVNRLKELGTTTQQGSLIGDGTALITADAATIKCEAGTRPSFFMQRDPTLLFAGVPTNRDLNLIGKNLPVRLDGQDTLGLGNPSTHPEMSSWTDMGNSFAEAIHGKVPASLEAAMGGLLAECPWISLGQPGKVPPYGFLNGGLHDGNQGWYPLFFEWSGEYYHVPFDSWDFVPQGREAKVQYGIKPEVKLSDTPHGDFVQLSGRAPVIPQVSAALKSVLKQVFTKMNPVELDSIISEADREKLLADVQSLEYISAPMESFTKQLTTYMQGTHVKPNSLPDGGTPKALQDALARSGEIGMDASAIELMDLQTDITPFASLVSAPSDPSKYSPFKPCIHGQFRFTKLSILDRFGQLVSTVDIETPTPVFPCLGETYTLQPLADGTANAILHRGDEYSCFVQLPPSINQPARINASFVNFDSSTGWRTMDEWENPVLAWIAVNLPDFSLQIFDAEGHFVREFRSVKGTTSSHPFSVVDLPSTAPPLLRDLMKQLGDPLYLEGLFTTLCDSIETVKHPPTAYAETMLSALCRPLALVQAGFSLELADPPLTNQSTISPNPGVVSASVTDYSFPMKLGDADNTFDGLAGYFELLTPSSPARVPTMAEQQQPSFDLSSFFTEFATQPMTARDPSKPQPGPFKLQPFYNDLPTSSAATNPTDYRIGRDSHLHILACLLDPFTPCHLYTQLLPLQRLQLPQWTISESLSRISTFLRMGPLLAPPSTVIPGFDSTRVVAHDYTLDDKTTPQPTGSIALPAFSMADFLWLQPYYQPAAGSSGEKTEYNFLELDKVPTKVDWKAEGPATAVEGYLQMSRPFGAGAAVPPADLQHSY